MNINKINATLAFKSTDNMEVIPVEKYDAVEKLDEFVSTTKKDPEETIMSGVKAATVSGVAIPTGLMAGGKIADKVEKLAVQFCDDFADDAAKKASEGITEQGLKGALKKVKNFSTTAITELPKRSKSFIKWGIGGAVALALIYLGTKDKNNDGQSDLIAAIKTFANPATEADF